MEWTNAEAEQAVADIERFLNVYGYAAPGATAAEEREGREGPPMLTPTFIDFWVCVGLMAIGWLLRQRGPRPPAVG